MDIISHSTSSGMRTCEYTAVSSALWNTKWPTFSKRHFFFIFFISNEIYILQTTISKAFYWLKSFIFWFEVCSWKSLFLEVHVSHRWFNSSPLEKMAAISQTFSNAFSWMKMCVLLFKFHWSLFLRVQLIISLYWLMYWLGAKPLPEPVMTQFSDAYIWH